jgi:hypothetical protein
LLNTFFHQLICFFFDGTDFHLTRFDQLKADEAYAAVIETDGQAMLSSHAVKRLFRNFSLLRVYKLRKVLQRLFLWRLHIERPEVIRLGIDTMVMDNDDALEREGVEPTYKKVKGFQPLQVFWGRYLVDAIFRRGSAHSNHGNHVRRVIRSLVGLIRTHYRADVPIVILADSGFFDQDLFALADELGLGFIIGGKMYPDIKAYVGDLPKEQFLTLQKDRRRWAYCEFANKRKSWSRFYRTLYTLPLSEDDGQITFEFARPETVIYTNVGLSNPITAALSRAGDSFISAEAVISAYHERARDELVNRGLKDFGTEHLPFKRFASNAAFYYLMVISFVLFESFKYDMGSQVIPLTFYAQTFRRRVLDVAGKITRSARRIRLSIPRQSALALDLDYLWRRLCEICSVSTVPIIV